MKTIHAPTLRRAVTEIFDAAGCSSEESHRIANRLVAANLTGHDSHGVVRIPRYLQWKNDGLIFADQRVEILSESPVLCALDGKYGFGQTVAEQAVTIGIEKCRKMGLSAITLKNSGHVGRVGDWAEMAADHGLISIHFVNAPGSVMVAPFGGADRRLSTAPYCIGVPRREGPAIVLDFATSIVAEGKVLVASQGGTPLRPDALVGPDGRVGNDTHLLYGDFEKIGKRDFRNGQGAIRAFGDHKGSGLAFMCEILGGALSGTGTPTPGRRFANGMLSVYLDPKAIDPGDFFAEEVARYARFFKEGKRIDPKQEILLPGEIEQQRRAQREAHGIPLADETWALLIAAASSLGVDLVRLAEQ